MKVLGIRSAPHSIRYALVEKKQDGSLLFLNATEENNLTIPQNINNLDQKLKWIHDEISRILRQNSDITMLAIKASEYGRGGEKKTSRESSYIDGVIMLSACLRGIKTDIKLYGAMKTNSREVIQAAKDSVGVSSKQWDRQMADAVYVAIVEMK